MLRSAEAVHRLAQRGDQGGPLPGRTRAQLRLRLAGSDRRSGRQVPRDRSQRRAARDARRRPSERAQEEQEEAARRRSRSKDEAAGRRPKPPGSDGLVPAARSGRSWRRRSSPARSAPASPSSTRPGFPPGAAYVESNPLLNIVRIRASTTSRTPTTSAMAPTGWSLDGGARTTASTTSACRGSRAGATRRSSTTRANHRDDPRPRVRDLHRRRPGQAGRLAPGRQHLLGRQRACCNSLTNDQMLGMARSADVMIPNQKPKQGGGRQR